MAARERTRSSGRTRAAKIVIGLLVLLVGTALISLLDTNRGSVRMLDMVREPSVYLAAALAVLGVILLPWIKLEFLELAAISRRVLKGSRFFRFSLHSLDSIIFIVIFARSAVPRRQ